MSKKLTIEFIRSEFAKEGYILLTKVYKNNLQKLDYICSKGHKHNISWLSWNRNNRCALCSGNRKLNIDVAKTIFMKEGYILISKVYTNARTLLKYICPNGHSHAISLDNFKQGYRCPYCMGRPIKNINDIRKDFFNEGYILLTTNYTNNKQKLKYVCTEGHVGTISLGSWYNGNRCKVCSYIKKSGSGHPNWKGGISCEPYCQDWTKEFKEYIKQRDCYKCLNPYCTSKNPNDLTIHHIDYNKKNCGPENLITVCRSCNSKANTNRMWHTSWYQAILNKRYKYIYDKKIKNNKSEVNYVRNK